MAAAEIQHEPVSVAGAIAPPWPDYVAQVGGRQPLCLPHNLHESPLFERTALAELIENYPREHYSIIHMDPQPLRGAVSGPVSAADARQWREGDIPGLTGEQTLRAIEQGRFWLNLRYTDLVDARFSALQDQIFETLEARLPSFCARFSAGSATATPSRALD